ncbi:MarR family transcriptional regulator [Saccharibacillus sp. CPCC 101409]|uniref:MarR family winged helix-turn-helix transcriptional regulator n=1 Tax=Saccharibacillus sp. CPCC 101409 TaxID=3058041 RepID=UPI00267145AC|nr:MarR family transcriptional regulator [Saccharibacillus sp. CPCC 101409]MDO3412232.1 MarR family transcriptional regulator [Saccharibacillus sp. CPCC 101409]
MKKNHARQVKVLYRIHGLSHLMNTVFESRFSMGQSRFELLTVIEDAETITQHQLGKQVELDAAAVTRHLQQLEFQGLIERKRSTKDLRNLLVQLTDLGKSQLRQAKIERRNLLEEIFEGIDDKALQTLEMLVSKLNSNAKLDRASHKNK